jgi:hypothetical protein
MLVLLGTHTFSKKAIAHQSDTVQRMSRHTQKIVGDILYVSYIHSREGPRRKNCPVNTCIYVRKNIKHMYGNLYRFVHDDVHVCACLYLHFVCATAQVPETNLCHYVD